MSISVKEMMDALSKLPEDAVLVVEEDHFSEVGVIGDIHVPYKESDGVYSIICVGVNPNQPDESW